MKLSITDVEEWENLCYAANKLEEKITNRIDEILQIIMEYFGYDKWDYTWYFEDALEGQMGHLDIRYDDISFIIEPLGHNDTYPDLANKDWDYGSSIPKEFLFMSDKDIINHIDSQRKLKKEKV